MAQQKSLHKNIKLLTWFNFFLDFRLYAPVMVIYFSRVSGSYALGMSVFSITMLAAAIFEIPTGIFSDLIGRKKTLITGAFATLVSVTFYAIGTWYWVLVIGAVLEGLARSFYSGNNESLLHDTLRESGQEQEYAQHYGKTSSALQFALALAAVVGGVVAYFSFSAVMWLSVIPAVVGVLLSLQVVEPKIIRQESANVYAHIVEAVNSFRKNSRLQKISVASVVEHAKGESGHLFLAAFYELLIPIWAIGLVRFFTHAFAAVSFYLSGKLIQRFGELKMLLFRMGYSFVSNVVALIISTMLSPIIIMTNSLFYGVASTSKSSLLQREYSEKQRSTMGSLNSLAGSLVFAVVAGLLGLAADILAPTSALFALQFLGLIPLFIWWSLFRKERK